MDALPPKVLVIGLGNELLGDDAVGPAVGRKVFEALAQKRLGLEMHYEAAELGGWRLVDLLPGYDRVVIVDSIQGGGGPLGTCYRIDLGDADTAHLTAAHGISLSDAVALAYPGDPAEVTVYGVEAERVWDFGEGLSEELERRVPAAVDDIVADLLVDLGVAPEAQSP